jgi:hypothetical protein
MTRQSFSKEDLLFAILNDVLLLKRRESDGEVSSGSISTGR